MMEWVAGQGRASPKFLPTQASSPQDASAEFKLLVCLDKVKLNCFTSASGSGADLASSPQAQTCSRRGVRAGSPLCRGAKGTHFLPYFLQRRLSSPTPGIPLSLAPSPCGIFVGSRMLRSQGQALYLSNGDTGQEA